MPGKPKSRGRILLPLLVAAVGIVFGAGAIALLRPLASAAPPGVATAARHDAQASPRPLSRSAVRARIEPSVVDVTATLTYDDETASGTGFVTGAGGGLILTNNHVIRDATSVVVTVPATGQTYPARIVGADLAVDIAVLQVGPVAGLSGAPLGNSAAVGAGTPVMSFGNQAGAGGSPAVASGVISGTGRTIQASDGASGFSETLHGMLATSARIEPGDSGGPLVSPAGTVIGVDTAAGAGGAAAGYAIPINTAMAAERQIAAGRPAAGISLGVQGFLGVMVESGTVGSPAVQRARDHASGAGAVVVPGGSSCVLTTEDAGPPAAIAPAPAGALVVGVLCGTGAATAGIAAGDVITAAGGRPVSSPGALTGIVDRYPPGTLLPVTWVAASGAARTSLVRLSQAPAA